MNSYRVEEFIALAKKDTDKNFNLLGLAFEAGFNSKSSFNQVFKKFKGKTPSEFLSWGVKFANLLIILYFCRFQLIIKY